MHQTVEGAKIENYTFRRGKDVIPVKKLPSHFQAILSGHIHRKQILTKNSDSQKIPIIYPGSTERTSFVEKNEEKGFFEIVFTNKNKLWKIKYLNFHVLPTRPMEELFIEKNLKHEILKPYLFAQIAKLNKNSIIRIKCDPELNIQIKKQLSQKFLRETFPKSLNFQLSSDFFKSTI